MTATAAFFNEFLTFNVKFSFKMRKSVISLPLTKFKRIFHFLALVHFTNGLSSELKVTLKIASELHPQFLTRTDENGSVRYKGFAKDFFDELSNLLGYQYEIILPTLLRNQKGSQDALRNSSNQDEIFGMIIRNEADLAFGNVEITTERAQVVDFSSPILSSRFTVLYKMHNGDHESFESSHWTLFEPFPISVWISFVLVAIMYIGFLKLFDFTNRGKILSLNREMKYSKQFSKVLLAVWLLLLFTSYISTFCAQKVLRATADLHKNSENFVDISMKKGIKISWLAHGPVERFFRNTVNEMYQKVYIDNVGKHKLLTDDDALKMFQQDYGSCAFISESFTIQNELDCSIKILPNEFGPIRHIAVATPIGSPLRERINQAVISLLEQGIIEGMYYRWFQNSQSDRNNFCYSANMKTLMQSTTTTTIEEMSPLFVFAIAGLLLSTVVVYFEGQILQKKVKSQSRQPKPPRMQAELLPKFNFETA